MLKRIYLPGEIYFITTKTFKNQKIFDNSLICELLIKVLVDCRLKYKFKLYGYVIIPDHVHLLIMPAEQNNISDAIRHIKGRFARLYNHQIAADKFRGYANDKLSPWPEFHLSADKNQTPPRRRGIHPRQVWQKSFYDHIIRNDLDFEEKLNYIHGNPIKHKITDNLDNYPWSSYQNYYFNKNDLIKIDYPDL
ncbi:MAG TPA: transposase [Patescibacteria group bacterium]|nr:transposase [Patescibacteria group bacterium]